MRFPGFIGPSYTLSSTNANCQRTVNLIPEVDQSGTGKGGEVMSFRHTPGLRKILEVGDGPIRCIHRDPAGRILVVSGNKLYKISETGGVWSASAAIGATMSTSTGAVRARSAYVNKSFASVDGGYDALATTTVFVDGSADNYCYQTWTQPTSISVPSPIDHEDFQKFGQVGTFMADYVGVPNATHIEFIDGYFILNKGGTGQFFVSGLNEPSVDPLDFASAEGDPDNIVALLSLERLLWLFGGDSVEAWSNTGNADFPFERVPGGFIEVGCFAPSSVAKTASQIFWLGRDKDGKVTVFQASNLSPRPISTNAVETAISKYANPENATGWVYGSPGHQFYQLNFAEMSWVYDLSTGLWHERAFLNDGNYSRHRADVHLYDPTRKLHIVGDYALNKIYLLDEDYYYDDETNIRRERVTPFVSAGKNRVFHHCLEIDMEIGVGIETEDPSAQGTDPVAFLSWSDDQGKTFGSEVETKIGKIGERDKVAKFTRLGSAKSRVYKFATSEPVPIRIIGAEIEIEQGIS